MKIILKKLIAIFLTLSLILSSFSEFSIFAIDISKQAKCFGIISDPHYFPESLINKESADFQYQTHRDQELMGESQSILNATLKTIAVRKEQGKFNMDYILVPGDLTYNGEKPGHIALSEIFKEFEKSTGIQVFVVPGNHDVNHYSATSYATPDGKRITARTNPDLLLTTPEDFKDIYSDFGYAQADSIYMPSSGKAGMLSYSVSLPGGFRLIAIDSCVYSADATSDGLDEQEGTMAITPELLTWAINQSKTAVDNGETVIGMVHGSIVEHFSYESVVSKTLLVKDFERVSYELADAGMHFVFTGHAHSTDTASIVSANNEIIFDMETCSLIGYPNEYREAKFDNTNKNKIIECELNTVDCDAECNVDISNISDKYGIIKKPFSENYTMPVLYGGSIELGIKNNAIIFADELFIGSIPNIIKKALPNGLSGLLKNKGIDVGSDLAVSPAFKKSLAGYNLSLKDFSAFLNAIVKQIDDKYIFNTTHTKEIVYKAVENLLRYELSPGDSSTELGKILMTGMSFYLAGNENYDSNPEFIKAIDSLRSKKGSDRLIEFLLDTIINDILFNEILPSITLNHLDSLLPAQVMKKIRSAYGNDLSVGVILDKILNTAAVSVNILPFFKIDDGRDLFKVIVYTAGYKYLNAGTRLKISNALADVIYTMTSDSNPSKNGDFGTTIAYEGKINTIPTTGNYRLPADINIVKGSASNEIFITWTTIQGINGSDIELSPTPANIKIYKSIETVKKAVPVIDFGFMKLNKDHILVKHCITVSGLIPGITYSYKIGDTEKGLISEESNFVINLNGDINQLSKYNDDVFFSKLLNSFNKLIDLIISYIDFIKILT